MFATLKLLRGVTCPDADCRRSPCLFSHEQATLSVQHVERAAKRPRFETPVPPPPKPTEAAAAIPRAAGPPRLTHFPGTHSPLALRNEILKLLYNAFFECYALLSDRRDLAYEHASEQERAIYKATKAHSYKAMAAQSIAKIKKREKPKLASDRLVGLIADVEQRARVAKAEAIKEPDATASMTANSVKPYTIEKASTIATKDYVLNLPPGTGGSEPDQVGKTRLCDRCQKSFIVKSLSNEVGLWSLTEVDQLKSFQREKAACQYHWGKLRNERGGGPTARRVYTCCGSISPCSIGAHVFTDTDASVLHARSEFLTTSSLALAAVHSEILALDCELVYTTAGLSLARLTAVLPGSSEAALDEFVRPPGAVLDCNTRFSGITSSEELESRAVLDLKGVQKALGGFIGPQTVLVGHGLENDLKALRLVHPLDRIVDTAILYPHHSGFPIRHSLRNLVKSYLGTFIQDQGTHDSAIDARAALELVALKIAAKGGEPRKVV